jgi:NhaP-type Na+/H+ or K+/H+ antiporter
MLMLMREIGGLAMGLAMGLAKEWARRKSERRATPLLEEVGET